MFEHKLVVPANLDSATRQELLALIRAVKRELDDVNDRLVALEP